MNILNKTVATSLQPNDTFYVVTGVGTVPADQQVTYSTIARGISAMGAGSATGAYVPLSAAGTMAYQASASYFTAAQVVAGYQPLSGSVLSLSAGNGIGISNTTGNIVVSNAGPIPNALYSASYLNNTPSFIENWTNLNNWSFAASANVQILSGGLYYKTGAGNLAAGNHAFVVSPTQTARAVFILNYVVGGAGGGVSIGVSSDSPGAAPAAGAPKSRQIYFPFNGIPVSYDQSVGTTIPNTTLTSGKYSVVINVDPINISICAMKVDGTIYARTKFSRNGYQVNNLLVGNSADLLLSGSNISLIGAHLGESSIYPRIGIEDQSVTEVYSSDGTYNYKVQLPLNYDSRNSYPTVIAFHANTGNEFQMTDSALTSAFAATFVSAGYIMVTAALAVNYSTWGALTGLNAYTAAYRFVRSNYNIGDVVFWAQSMGGLESLNTLAFGRIPGVKCWIGTLPVCNLSWAYGSGNWTSLINTAYNIVSGNYVTQTAGYDPMLQPGNAFGNIPMLFCYATDDTYVLPANNTLQFQSLIGPYTTTVQTLTTNQGLGHNSNISPFASGALAFAETYITHRPDKVSTSWGSIGGTIADQTDLINTFQNIASPVQRPQLMPAPSTLGGLFNPVTSTYNATASSLRISRAALSKVLGLSGRMDVVAIGTSLTGGGGASTKAVGSYPSQLRNLLINAGYPDGGTGFIPGQWNGTNDTRVTLTSGWSPFSAAVCSLIQCVSAGQPVTFTDTNPSTQIDVIYYDYYSFGASWTIDGVAQSDIPGTSTQTIKKVTVTGLSSIPHTVVITPKTGTDGSHQYYILGVKFYNATGVTVNNLGIGGATTSSLAGASTFYNLPLAKFIAPQLTIIESGANDSVSLVLPSNYQGLITTMITGMQSVGSDVILYGEPPTGAARPSAATIPILYGLADTYNCAMIDINDRLVSWSSLDSLGFGYDTDGLLVHLTDPGYLEVAKAVANVLQVNGPGQILSVAAGGTGTKNPSLIAGPNVTITGTWPNQTITAAASGSGVGSVTSVSVSAINGIIGFVDTPTTTPNISISLSAINPFSVNGLTLQSNATGWQIAGGTTSKTLTISNSMTIAGTDGRTYTMPSINTTIAGLGVTQVWTGAQAFNTAARAASWFPYFTVTAPADTVMTAGTAFTGILFDTNTRTWAGTGTIAVQTETLVKPPTYASASTQTFTKAATFALSGAPIAGSNVIITNPYTLWVQAGASQFDGAIIGSSGITVSSPISGIGYSTGAGGTVVQSSSKSTGVTLNKVTGQITMNNASLGANTAVHFTLTNSTIAATDVVQVTVASGTSSDYLTNTSSTTNGSCVVTVYNATSGPLSEAIVLNFVVIKAVNA